MTKKSVFYYLRKFLHFPTINLSSDVEMSYIYFNQMKLENRFDPLYDSLLIIIFFVKSFNNASKTQKKIAIPTKNLQPKNNN